MLYPYLCHTLAMHLRFIIFVQNTINYTHGLNLNLFANYANSRKPFFTTRQHKSH